MGGNTHLVLQHSRDVCVYQGLKAPPGARPSLVTAELAEATKMAKYHSSSTPSKARSHTWPLQAAGLQRVVHLGAAARRAGTAV